MIMIANMKNAAMEDTTFSTAPNALNNASSTSTPPGVPPRRDRSFGRNGGDQCVEFAHRIAAALAAGVEPFGPGLGDALQQFLELVRLHRLEAHAGGFR